MAETISSVSSQPKEPQKERAPRPIAADRAAVAELVRAARARGEGSPALGVLKSTTATGQETALEEKTTDHLGHAKDRALEGGASNTRTKTVLTDAAVS